MPSAIAPLSLAFYSRDATTVAKDLIGTILVRRLRGKAYRARLVETEAYVGCHDLACHAAKGRTQRTDVMWGPAGRAYVYFIYGMYDMLNIVTGDEDDAQAVLIRAAEALDGWDADLSGPGKLTRAMKITRDENKWDLTRGEKLFLIPAERSTPTRIAVTARVGVDYSKEWKDAPLRFYDPESGDVSRKPRNDVMVTAS